MYAPLAHTGIVCENMHALGENLRKLLLQAKICTPPGGAMVAKICKLCTVTNTVLGSQTHLLSLPPTASLIASFQCAKTCV